MRSKRKMDAAASLEPLKIGDKIIKQYFPSKIRSAKPLHIEFKEPARVETVILDIKGC